MKPGDLVRCTIWGRIGIVIEPPRAGAYGEAKGLVRVLWGFRELPMIEHVYTLEVISETR